jgi:ribosomal protein S15P/S13E
MKNSNDHSQDLAFLASSQEISSMGQLIKLYTEAFGSITLTVEPPLDELAILQEINDKLHLTGPNEINYLEKRIYTLVNEISTSYKDKNLFSNLNLMKEKAWRLLETMTDYAKKEYNYNL